MSSFEELVSTPFAGGVNAMCWQRTLPGNFGEIVDKLAIGPGITTLDEDRLQQLDLSEAGQVARDVLLEDQRMLRERDLAPVLDFINGYVRDTADDDEEEEEEALPTHVQSFHVDSATVAADTFLCTYHGSSSEALPPEEAVRHVDVPGTRAALLKLYGGDDDEGFLEYLNDRFYDLHYAPLPDARPYSFGVGNLWRIAIQYPGCPVPPCVHRAPDTLPGRPRLLLIS
ncbi:MAG TPA: hypothetical protein VGE29_10465 [Prosthecobacter sp.]